MGYQKHGVPLMKRWQIAIIIIVVLGSISGLELNIYLRHHPRMTKKIITIPRVIKKTTVKTMKQLQRNFVQIGLATKAQYMMIAKKTVQAKRSGQTNKVVLVGLSIVLVGSVLVFIVRRIAKQPRVLKAQNVFELDDDLPPLPEQKDPDIHADKVAEVLRARRTLQGKPEGKLSPLGKHIKKYELTDQVASLDGRVLHRIRSLVRLKNSEGLVVAEQGELGGYIEQESNLSHYRNAWVAEQAAVFGNAKVYGDAVVAGQAKVSDKARIYDLARVDGSTFVSGAAEICGKVHISQGTYTEGKRS